MTLTQTNSTRVKSSAPGDPQRPYGVWSGVFLVVASMVGAGILTSPGYTLQQTGNPWGLLAIWILGGIMALCGALCLAEMATALPRMGGDYVFVREAFGRETGAVAGWATFFLGFAAPTAVVARLSANYLTAPFLDMGTDFIPHWFWAHREPIVATLLISLISLVHCLGAAESAALQAITTLAKVVMLLGLAGIGFFLGKGDWGHFSAGHWPLGGEWSALGTGLAYVGYAYAGWNGAAYLAGEIRDPRRQLPYALVGGCLGVTALYLLLNGYYVWAIDMEKIQSLNPGEAGRIAEIAARESLGSGIAGIVAILFGVGLVASASAYLLTGPRVVVAMARDGAFPRFAGTILVRRGTPAMATVCQGVVSIACCWSGSFLELLDYTSVGLTAVSAMVVASVIPLRRRTDLAPAFRVWFHPLPAFLYLLLSVWTIVVMVMDPDRRLPSLLSLVTIALGIPAAKWVLANGRKAPTDPMESP